MGFHDFAEIFAASDRGLPGATEDLVRFLETRQEVSVFAGSMSPGTGRFGYGPQSGTSFGARYGITLGGPFGLEGAVTFLPTDRAIIDPGRAEGDFKVGEMPWGVYIPESDQ